MSKKIGAFQEEPAIGNNLFKIQKKEIFGYYFNKFYYFFDSDN